ncbi:transposase domain-containing protein [Lactobacillus hamsteri]
MRQVHKLYTRASRNIRACFIQWQFRISNNKTERAVKSLIMGHNSKSFKGAAANGIILSLIETAKRNELDPEKYLNYLLQKLPNKDILNSATSRGLLL